ncbi:MAG: hypothetical protein U0271_33895 [Polyangiaceae bacterium]
MNLIRLLIAPSAASLFFLANAARAEPPTPTDVSEETPALVSVPNSAVWGPGLGTVLSSTVASTVMGFMAYEFAPVCEDGGSICGKNDAQVYLYGAIPIAGPIVVAADDRVGDDVRAVFALFSVGQVLGTTLTVLGFAKPKLVPADQASASTLDSLTVAVSVDRVVVGGAF